MNKMNSAMVTFVGAGPGDPALLTEKGCCCIRQADVIVYDALVHPSLLNLAKPDCKLIFVGKRAGNHWKTQDEIHTILIELAQQGNAVVRLQGGDPFVFGRGGEEAQALAACGISFQFVPGVSSCYSVPEYAGIPVTHRDCASSFHVITGHKRADGRQSLDYATLAKLDGTLVFLMGLHNLSQIADGLIACGKSPETPAAVIQQGSTSHQRTVVSSLAEIAHVVQQHQLSTPAVIVIGETAAFQKQLKWFACAPLSGKKVIITGTPEYARRLGENLRQYGADATEISLIRLAKTACYSLNQIDFSTYSWLVLTSANGVRLFFDALQEQQIDLRRLMHLKFAVIGAGTAAALEKMGFYADCIPAQYDSYGLADALIPQLSDMDQVLIFRAENGSDVLPSHLRDAGKAVTIVPLYRTETNPTRQVILQQNLPDADYIVFSSPSAVRAFVELSDLETSCPVKVVSIGQVTAKTAAQAGLSAELVAEEATASGIAACILQDVARNEV